MCVCVCDSQQVSATPELDLCSVGAAGAFLEHFECSYLTNFRKMNLLVDFSKTVIPKQIFTTPLNPS